MASSYKGTSMNKDELIKKLKEELRRERESLDQAKTVLIRCEFGLQPEFYGGKDNGSLKDVRALLPIINQTQEQRKIKPE